MVNQICQVNFGQKLTDWLQSPFLLGFPVLADKILIHGVVYHGVVIHHEECWMVGNLLDKARNVFP